MKSWWRTSKGNHYSSTRTLAKIRYLLIELNFYNLRQTIDSKRYLVNKLIDMISQLALSEPILTLVLSTPLTNHVSDHNQSNRATSRTILKVSTPQQGIGNLGIGSVALAILITKQKHWIKIDLLNS